MPPRILVTGGAGFIGSHLVDHLLEKTAAARVVVLDLLTYAGRRENLAQAENDPRFRFVHGDICDAEFVTDLLAAENIGTVFHLAAESHVDRSIDSADAFLRTNVLGTAALLECFRKHPAGRLFVHVSTDEVFGSLAPEDRPFDETSSYQPGSPYSASKAAADHLVRAWVRTHGLPAIIVNSSNAYGPRQFPEKLLPLMILKARRGEPLPIYGDGRQVRDWLYVSDLCRALAEIAENGIPGSTYLVGGGCEMTNLDVVSRLVEILAGFSPGLPHAEITHVADRPGHDRRYAVESGKIRRELGWQPEIPFSDGLLWTVEWYLANTAWTDAIERGGYRPERLGGKS